jgi:hypothetical protein
MATKFFYGETPKELADEGIRLESYPVALRQDNTKHAERIARYWAECEKSPTAPPQSSEERQKQKERLIARWGTSLGM